MTTKTTTKCESCGHDGCEIRMIGCGCSMHARCTPLIGKDITTPISACPMCSSPCIGLYMVPISFDEVDRLSKSVLLPESFQPGGVETERTGRWSTEEITYTQSLIRNFELGYLPLRQGTKLIDFLSRILMCKPTRLSKKFHSVTCKAYEPRVGHLCGPLYRNSMESSSFSEIYTLFLRSVPSPLVQTEIRVSASKTWCEHFSNWCVELGQPLDIEDWLKSVEEHDRRVLEGKRAFRHLSKRMRLEHAFQSNPNSTSSINSSGVYVDQNNRRSHICHHEAGVQSMSEEEQFWLVQTLSDSEDAKELDFHFSGPFLTEVIRFTKELNLPFYMADVWVPAFSPAKNPTQIMNNDIRLCYAGHAVQTDHARAEYMHEFGEYSKAFSFAPGHGLPGKVYSSSQPTWELGLCSAHPSRFERCNGAKVYGINTALGLPVASASIGKIVLALYSDQLLVQDDQIVRSLSNKLKSLNPFPKWSLVIDCGDDEVARFPLKTIGSASDPDVQVSSSTTPKPNPEATDKQEEVNEGTIANLLAEQMPLEESSWTSAFVNLRLLLLRSPTCRSAKEEEIIAIIKRSYQSYKSVGRKNKDVASLITQDSLYLLSSLNRKGVRNSRSASISSSSSLSPSFTASSSSTGKDPFPLSQRII